MSRWSNGAATVTISCCWFFWQLRSAATLAAARAALLTPQGWSAMVLRGILVGFIVWCVISLTTTLVLARKADVDVRTVFVTALVAALTLVFDSGWNALIAAEPAALLATALAGWALADTARVWFAASVTTVRMSAWLCGLAAVALQPVWLGVWLAASATLMWRWWRGNTRPEWIPAVAAATIALLVVEVVAWQTQGTGLLAMMVHAWRQWAMRSHAWPLLAAVGTSLSALMLASAIVGVAALAMVRGARFTALAALAIMSPPLFWLHGGSAATPIVFGIAILAAVGVHQIVAGIRFAPGRAIVAAALGVVLVVPAFVL
ncbi:MAG: hypothetical protein KBG15_00055 [Kofleriaceae bacterium]|nr:hypothetical protein [Kofleriaceae bacterium]